MFNIYQILQYLVLLQSSLNLLNDFFKEAGILADFPSCIIWVKTQKLLLKLVFLIHVKIIMIVSFQNNQNSADES